MDTLQPTKEQLNNRLSGVPESELQGIANKNPAQFNDLADAAGWDKKPPSSTINADSLGSTNNLKLAEKSNLNSYDVSNLMSTDSKITPIKSINELDSLNTQSKSKASDLESTIIKETSPYEQQLNELNTQIKMHQADSLARQEKALQSGETTGFASREAQNLARTDAIEAMRLSAVAEGLRGNIALAEKHATRAINTKYEEIDKKISIARQNIYDNYDSFTASEKKKADATLLRLDRQDALVQTEKEDQKTIIGLATTAAKNKAPSLVVSKALQAKTPEEALAILGSYMSDPTTTPKGSVRSGNLNYTPQDQQEDSQALNASRGEDGYVDPTLYKKLHDAWIANGGKLEDFQKTYPAKNYVNPKNTWLPPFLMPGGKPASTREI